MNFKSAILTALRALNKNKMRSALTSIGIIIGILSVIVMVGLGNSARVTVREKVFSYGANALSIRTDERMISVGDLKTLKESYYQIRYISPFVKKRYQTVKYRNITTHEVEVYGVSNEYFRIKEWDVVRGRMFSEEEIVNVAKVCTIGETIRKEIFPFTNPIGKQIVVGDVPMKIVGVMDPLGESFGGRDFDKVVVIPYTTANTRFYKRLGFDEIYVSTFNEDAVEPIAKNLRLYFRRKFNILEGQKDSFRVYTSQDKLKMANDISNALAILLAGIASISLFVGGVGIMNIMLVSVTERTREIGIRMAIGAKKRDIMSQFLIESVTLSVGGGIVGVSLGLLIYYVIIYFVEWPFIFSISSILVSVLFSAAVGIFFGYYPAKKASNLKPIEALKYE